MRSGAMFADVLDAELGCTDVPSSRGPGSRILTSPLFVFERPLTTARPVHPGLAALARPGDMPGGRAPLQSHLANRVDVQESTPPRNPPAVSTVKPTMLEVRAMRALNRLGAGLDEGLSLDVLRRAFRRLARRYHPDRHPGSSPAEHARLARLFAEATGHYRVLSAVFDRQDAAR